MAAVVMRQTTDREVLGSKLHWKLIFLILIHPLLSFFFSHSLFLSQSKNSHDESHLALRYHLVAEGVSTTVELLKRRQRSFRLAAGGAVVPGLFGFGLLDDEDKIGFDLRSNSRFEKSF